MAKPVRRLLGALWEYLREVSGENDYDRYCERVRRSGGRPRTRQAFYRERQDHRHSRPTCCC